MLASQLIPLNAPPAIIGVNRVQVESMAARNQGQSLIHVGPQLIDVSRFTGVIASRLNASSGQPGSAFETADIVPLPAMQRNAGFCQVCQSLLDIHSELRIPLPGQFVCLLDESVILHVKSL